MANKNEIYQFSLISALMSGLASPSYSLPISTLLTRGTFGVGTFSSMDGEMVILDSVPYQFHADGTTRVVSGEQLVPFAMVSHFKPDPKLSRAIKLESKKALLERIEEMVPGAKNAFVLFKVKGRFERIKIRAIHRQSFPGQKLSELTENQMIKEFHGVKGTIVGVRSPGWSHGVSVVGVHAHFIDEERKSGGHILELESEGEVGVEVAVCRRFHLELPESEEFGVRELEVDEVGIRKAEG